MNLKRCILTILVFFLPSFAYASAVKLNLDATNTFTGILCLVIFIIAYICVMTEEFTQLRKSKPVIIAAGIIWAIVAFLCSQQGMSKTLALAIRANILEFSELFMFLLVAMTYVNVMEERNVFVALRCWIVARNFSYKSLFWVTGWLAFFISPIADNLTTALILCTAVMAVAKDKRAFITLSCINIVVAANAGGAYSPFGDITTLMVWQHRIIPFFDFFAIFLPSVITFVIPAYIMSFAVEKGCPKVTTETVSVKHGGVFVIYLFLFTIATSVTFHNSLNIPPMIGMMTGLGYLNFFAFYLKRRDMKLIKEGKFDPAPKPFDIFNRIKLAEWDTLFFFYGIILSVGGLAALGYLSHLSDIMYHHWGAHLSELHKATPANVTIGILSAIIDNIPVMYAVLTMSPQMSEGQWLLATLTTGTGGSLLSIGSAAGVALMGTSRGLYTFFGHLKWSWAILLGYVAGIVAHIYLNHDLFLNPVVINGY